MPFFPLVVFSILVNGEETGVLQNEGYKKEAREDWADVQLLPARETLARGVEREGAISSSGDNFSEIPRVAFLSKPQDPVTPLKEDNGKKRRKGKGRKRDPCLRKYKDYCFYGECRYIRILKAPSCMCHKQGAYDVENEEKVKLGSTGNH
ncbi:hypothetical protein JD844_017065 [Phrynosoma platyrhinos]|uniref:Proheparin-binding EGF-like growth factor n=1 Tax=Phrynosoma platyrhinos TaxID=52577 RepID=A0ABQ7SL65_PHRPL|nr:hypothetical protein JD844_017065 [Phrynosoma platyrhinos]